MIQSRKRSDPPPRPVTLSAAEDLGAFELAELWADRMAWPVDKRTPYDELAELAVMSALAAWLRRWQPIAIHSAMLAGGRGVRRSGDGARVRTRAGVPGDWWAAMLSAWSPARLTTGRGGAPGLTGARKTGAGWFMAGYPVPAGQFG
jgi:hypothetical protein